MQAHEINDLFEQESPVGQLYVRLKELGIAVEREWWIDEAGAVYIVDLAAPVIRTPRGKVWEAGLIIVLLFALVQNDVHLVPNPLMPYSVALSHFIETASSNLIFAVILTWLMARKAKLPQTRFGDCYDPGHVESISRLTRRV
jgi:hypothetical protein